MRLGPRIWLDDGRIIASLFVQRNQNAIPCCISIQYTLPFSLQKRSLSVTTNQTQLPNLEESLAEISQLIEKMEHDELTLEHSLSHFERGITFDQTLSKDP